MTSSSDMISERLKEIVNEFNPSKFEPSYLYRNNHWQTIVGTGALQSKFFGQPVRPFKVTKERFDTLDGDFFDVEYTEDFADRHSDKSVLLLHGLESTTEGTIMTSLTTAFLAKGFSCCLVSFRSCSGEENRYDVVCGWLVA